MQSTRVGNGHNSREEKARREIPSWAKVMAWLVTTAIAAAALILSVDGRSAQESAKKLADEQSQQITELQKTTPVGEITGMAAHHPQKHLPSITNIRNNPVLGQQIYDLSGVSSDVPDNGSLFIVVHDYGQPTLFFSDPPAHFFITHVTLYGKSGANQHWKAGGVYIGGQSVPKHPVSYRLTLYFCNSVDAEKMVVATRARAARNSGLRSLPYPSCKQLDSIFVTRASK
jgi:hypothetical protein